MKKYQNVTERMLAIEFETFTQYLRRGDVIECNEAVKRIPQGIVVTSLEKPKRSPKKVTTEE
jgi:hypothetical protein